MAAVSENKIQLSYAHIQRWEVITGVTLISTLLVMGIYYLHPMNSDWYEDENFSFTNLLQFVFIDQFLIELITTFIISRIIGSYAKAFKIGNIEFNFRGIASYLFKFIPLYGIAYFFTAPVTVNVRFLYHYFIRGQQQINYFNSYFFLNKGLYLAYLLPIALIISILLVIVIIKSKNAQENPIPEKTIKNVSLYVKTETGEKIIGSDTVSWLLKEGRKYYAHTKENKTYHINKNLTQLKSELDINFVLINRSTLINLDYFEDYSFWENEKYVVRMKDGTEFQSTRERIKDLKQKIDLYNSYN